MIIFPDAFALSADAAGVGLRFPRVCYQTYTFALTDAAVTASTEITGAPKDAPLRPDTAEYWEASALPATWEIDLGSTVNVDYAGIAGHDIGSNGASVKIETSLGDFTGSPLTQVWTEFGTEVAPDDDSALLYLDDVRTARYARITLTGAGSVPHIAVFYIGVALAMEREADGGGFQPITMARQTELHQSLSRGGQFLGQGFRRTGLSAGVSFKHLDPAWYRANFDAFAKHARNLPYFFAWWPEQYTEDVAFVWTPDDITPAYMGVKDLMQVNWNMNGVGHE